MQQYLELGKHIVSNGNRRGDRTGTGTIGLFGYQMRFDLNKGFPLLTTKKMFMRGIIHELLWFLKGDTNNNSLLEHNVHIWDEWATETGDLGPVYGKQWRSWLGKAEYIRYDNPAFPKNAVTAGEDEMGAWVRTEHDQIKDLIEGLKKKPFSRRHIVSAWNVEDLPDETKSPQQNVLDGKMALAPCHCLFQFYVREMSIRERALYAEATLSAVTEHWDVFSMYSDEEWEAYVDAQNIPKYKLDCQLYQRSADFCLGVPFNIASYALFTMMVAQCVNMIPGDFVHTFGDVHIYNNHEDTFITQQLDREPLALPKIWINPEKKDIFSFTIDDFKLEGYESHPKIEYPISV